MRRASKATAVCGIGVSSFAVAQMGYLRLCYDPRVLPEPKGTHDGCAGSTNPGKPLRLLFVGDSVCVGVGALLAAPLQRACAERMAVLRGTPVTWKTICRNGADVRELRALLRTDDDRHSRDLHANVTHPDSFDFAIVFCGVNDGKKLLTEFRLPHDFREDLSALCATLRREAPRARIVVPTFPELTQAPIFRCWPLYHLAGLMIHAFDGQKEAIAQTENIKCPICPGVPAGDGDEEYWAVDGIHPSKKGYHFIGQWLGTFLQRIE